MKKILFWIIAIIFIILSWSLCFKSCYNASNSFKKYEKLKNEIEEKNIIIDTNVKEDSIDKKSLSTKDIELIALVVMAEAESEPDVGKRLVIDTILNRVDHERFPDTVHDVIYQPNQFTSMWNGRIKRCEVKENICELVKEELERRLDYDTIFFNANHYSVYGSPLYNVENHYFSSYK